MKRHETEVKSFLMGKITNLKEDIIQGQFAGATKRYLHIEAVLEAQDNQWSLKLLG